jgi:hypothetical protein
MKKIYFALFLFVATLCTIGLQSCRFNCVHGSGNQISETRKFGEFDRISVSGGYKVVLKQDSSFGIKITADDNLLKYIKTEVANQKLKIYSKRNFCNNSQLVINIGVKSLKELKATGGIELISDGKIITKDIAFKLTGATKLSIELNAINVTTTGSGATEVNLKGNASSHIIDLSGSGKVNALDFAVNNCDIQTAGVGESRVNVTNILNIHSSGASSVKYKGNPQITNDKSGASSVEKVD